MKGGDGREGSIQGSGVQPRRGRSGLDEMTEDSQALLRIGDDGEDPHRGTTAGAAQGIHLINLCEQSDPGGAGLYGGHGLIRGVL